MTTDPNEDFIALPWYTLKEHRIAVQPSLAQAIGEIVAHWGSFENDVTHDIGSMMRFPIVRRLSSHHPRAFKKRIELWRRCVDALFPSVTVYRDYAERICSDAKQLSIVRNKLLHGIWTRDKEKDDRWIVFITDGLDETDINGVYVDYEKTAEVLLSIIRVRTQFIEFTVNRHWHADLGLFYEVLGQEPGSPAHLTIQNDELLQCSDRRLDSAYPERMARLFLF
jgi:hypothetical protein